MKKLFVVMAVGGLLVLSLVAGAQAQEPTICFRKW
jgi:hypothetical protein